MTLENWLAFVIAYAVISLLPGPSVLMVIGQTLSKGKRAAMFCILGDVAGGVIVMSAAFAGLGLILAGSSVAFGIIKWAGILYLLWLGVAEFRAARRSGDMRHISKAERIVSAPSASIRAGFLTGILNPKAIIFYMAFLAQFITADAPQFPQFLILMATSSMLVTFVLGIYVLLAATAQSVLREQASYRRIHLASGTAYLGGSVLLAGAERA